MKLYFNGYGLSDFTSKKKNIFGTVERFEKSNLSEFLLDKKSIAE